MSGRIWTLGWKLALLAAGAFAVPVLGVTPAAAAPDQGIVCSDGTLAGSTRTFDLTTADGYIYTPDGNTVYSWSYTATGEFQLPGPVLCAKQGETVVVNLTNNLPVPTSIVFPGQQGVTSTGGSCPTGACLFAREAAASGGTVSYTFPASQPGTYLYESGTNQTLDVEMGLYGALVIRPTLGNNFAYGAARTQFDPAREQALVLAEVDPVFHLAVERQVGAGQPVKIDPTKRHPRYFLVNGRGFPDTLYDNFVPWLPNQPYGALVRVQPIDLTAAKPAMIRYVNAGLDNHPFHPHGNHMVVIGRDGRLLQGPAGEDTSFQDFTRTVGAGQTYDLFWQWIFADDPATGKNGQAWDPVTNVITATVPSYRNLMFKDDDTYYGGNPYLGYSGQLPTGTVTQNTCGEYYFPWHSHALNEFVNFDEGFGGMATIVRVDPPGGVAVDGRSCG
jgi:FtsP/CotA-like multicopper oxidase with cupredoxin domain